MMGGDITVDSQPGVGSVFTLSLDLPGTKPDQPEAPVATADHLPAAHADAAHPGGPGWTCWWPTTIRSTASSLMQHPAGPHGPPGAPGRATAPLAVDAVASAQVPDLVLMDLHMPVLDGLQRHHVRSARRTGAGVQACPSWP
jgi:hypothetical protein